VAVFKTNTGKYDVTFAVNNGASLAPWDPTFLNTAPAAASTSGPGAAGLGVLTLVVPKEKLISVGSDFYALALVQAGTPSTSSMGAGTTTVAAAGAEATAHVFTVATLPPPVVLIHGLWGDLASLKSTTAYLKNFGTNPNVLPICYSPNFKFDAVYDPLQSTQECENTSTEQLNAKLLQIYNSLDSAGYVGGRVDIVAHSMGGLVARLYSANPAYESIRNRNQGAFHTIVTLDTPEAGSQLASFLLLPDSSGIIFADKTVGTRNPNDTNPRFSPWWQLCGRDTSKTFSECLVRRFLPIAAPGFDYCTGAIWSLIPPGAYVTPPHSAYACTPPGSDIANLPAPNIPNATWYAIGSDFVDNGQQVAGPITRIFLDSIVAGTYPESQTPDTLSGILGTPDNDVIVSLDSQLFGSLPAQRSVFENLAHSPLNAYPNFTAEWILGAPKGTFSIATVTDCADVNAQIAAWLGYAPQRATRTGCTAAAATQAQSLRASSEVLPMLDVTGGVQAAELGKQVRISLSRFTKPIKSVEIVQSSRGKTLSNRRPNDEDFGGRGAAVLVENEGSRSVAMVPLQVGLVEVTLNVVYQDGTSAKQSFPVNVSMPDGGLTKFTINSGMTTLAIVLNKDHYGAPVWLHPEVYSDQMKYPISLVGSNKVNFTVDQDLEDPIVSVDPNGLVHGVRAGQAVIVGHFGRLVNSITVTVYPEDSPPAGYKVMAIHPPL
jgi:pimeloyl-ACP methyl ester carboxylesterase